MQTPKEMVENNRGKVFSLMKETNLGVRPNTTDLGVKFLSMEEKRVPAMSRREAASKNQKKEEDGGFWGTVMGWLGCHGK